jgi:hypothetical protein
VSRCSVATASDYDRPTPPELDVDRAEPTGEYQIVLPDGRPLSTGTQVTGRGRRLRFLTDASWYQLECPISRDGLTSELGAEHR